MAPTPRRPSAPEPLKPNLGLFGAGLIILILIAGLLWWVNGAAWSAEQLCLDAGGRWVDGACEGAGAE